MNERGVALILVSMLLVGLTIFSTAIISSNFSENTFAQKYLESTQAFWLSEAGIDRALYNLRNNSTIVDKTALGQGAYSVTIVYNGNNTYNVTSQGAIPFDAPFVSSRVIQAVIDRTPIPDDFYDYVIWSSGNILIKGTGQGNFGSVGGDVISGGNINTIPAATPPGDVITGSISTNDPTATPLPLLDFKILRDVSQIQGNYYTTADLKNPTFPTSFWNNQTLGIPNVVFIEGDLVLKGGDNVGGFFVVGGDTIYTTTISGNVGIDGSIYTPGPINVDGGGTNLNIDGCIWAGSVLLEGSITLTYNAQYAQIIRDSGFNTIFRLTSWRDTQNPYQLSE